MSWSLSTINLYSWVQDASSVIGELIVMDAGLSVPVYEVAPVPVQPFQVYLSPSTTDGAVASTLTTVSSSYQCSPTVGSVAPKFVTIVSLY